MLLAHRLHRVSVLHQPIKLTVEARLDRLHVRHQLGRDELALGVKVTRERFLVDFADLVGQDRQPVDVSEDPTVVLM